MKYITKTKELIGKIIIDVQCAEEILGLKFADNTACLFYAQGYEGTIDEFSLIDSSRAEDSQLVRMEFISEEEYKKRTAAKKEKTAKENKEKDLQTYRELKRRFGDIDT